MQKRSMSMTDDDKEVRSATKYIIMTSVLFYITVIPLVLLTLMRPHLKLCAVEIMHLFVAYVSRCTEL